MTRLPSTLVLYLALVGGAAAQPAAEPRPPLWELGLFGVTGTQLAYPGSAQRVTPTLVLPYFVYRGPLLRADQGTVGLRAARTATTELDIGFAGAFGSAASDNRVRRGMPDSGTRVAFGPRRRIDLGRAPGGGRGGAALPLRGVFDRADGCAHRGIPFEPSRSWSRTARGGWRYGVAG
ncbi:MAG: MipA/OmpV family protein, partial [Pseudomonadota bacterium]